MGRDIGTPVRGLRVAWVQFRWPCAALTALALVALADIAWTEMLRPPAASRGIIPQVAHLEPLASATTRSSSHTQLQRGRATSRAIKQDHGAFAVALSVKGEGAAPWALRVVACWVMFEGY
jgi:hypothetical protein